MSENSHRTQCVQRLGREFGEVHHALWSELVQLRWEWKELLALFGEPGERLDVLNESAGAFFALVQHALSQHILSAIANLTDRPETGGQSNLTVLRLPALARAFEPAFGDELDALVATRAPTWKPIRDWRHKHLAHLDLDVALERRAVPLTAVRKADVDAALVALTEVIHAVQKRVRPGTDIRYDVAGRHGGADALIAVLLRARQDEKERRERMRTGRAIPEDLSR